MLTDEDLKNIDGLIKKRVSPINKKLNLIIRYFDRLSTNHEHRIRQVEDHLHLPKTTD